VSAHRIKLYIGVGVIVLVIAYLVVGGLRETMVYFLTPGELLAQEAKYGDGKRRVRLGGLVQKGSIRWNPAALDLRFRLEEGEHSVEVRHRGAPPDLFKEGQGAVVEGTYERGKWFAAASIMAKHSENYTPERDYSSPEARRKAMETVVGGTTP